MKKKNIFNFKSLISVFQIAIIFCMLTNSSDMNAQANWELGL